MLAAELSALDDRNRARRPVRLRPSCSNDDELLVTL
jgi:hypothetical protein